MKNSVKNLIMFFVSAIAGLIMTGGIPDTTPETIVFAVTVVGSTLVYMSKNWLFPSISVLGVFDVRDVLSALFLGIGTGFSEYVGVLIAGAPFTWSGLLTAVVTVIAGYFMKTKFLQGEKQ